MIFLSQTKEYLLLNWQKQVTNSDYICILNSPEDLYETDKSVADSEDLKYNTVD
ncbi:MAG TPA: hypothetical protein VMV47_15330 [Bacteroidales bacterium]|nr:hypothetical protein [Bacteroidales bacterium]